MERNSKMSNKEQGTVLYDFIFPPQGTQLDEILVISSLAKRKEPPKIFWKYFDLFRRKQISVQEFSSLTEISLLELEQYTEHIGSF